MIKLFEDVKNFICIVELSQSLLSEKLQNVSAAKNSCRFKKNIPLIHIKTAVVFTGRIVV